jgi:hypothetical protein
MNTTTLPSTGVGAAAAVSAFAGYTALALILAILAILFLVGSAALMRSR